MAHDRERTLNVKVLNACGTKRCSRDLHWPSTLCPTGPPVWDGPRYIYRPTQWFFFAEPEAYMEILCILERSNHLLDFLRSLEPLGQRHTDMSAQSGEDHGGVR